MAWPYDAPLVLEMAAAWVVSQAKMARSRTRLQVLETTTRKVSEMMAARQPQVSQAKLARSRVQKLPGMPAASHARPVSEAKDQPHALQLVSQETTARPARVLQLVSQAPAAEALAQAKATQLVALA